MSQCIWEDSCIQDCDYTLCTQHYFHMTLDKDLGIFGLYMLEREGNLYFVYILVGNLVDFL